MSKANDPFNFDDLYKQAGVDNLFVKKSMAEQKAMVTKPAATPPRPTANGTASSPAATASYGGLGTVRAQQQSPSRATPASAGNSGSTNSLKGLDLDPFADLGSVSKPPPMASSKSSSPPAVSATARPPTPSSTSSSKVLSPSASQHQPAAAALPPVSSLSPAAAGSTGPSTGSPPTHSTHAFDLEDMFGPTASTGVKQQQPTSSNTPGTTAHAAHDDPFAAFDAVEGAAAAVPATPPPAPQPAAAQAAAVAKPAAEPRQPSPAATPVQDQQGIDTQNSGSPVASALKASSAYFAQLEQEQQQRRHQQQQERVQQDRPHSSSRYDVQPTAAGSFSALSAEQRHGAAAAPGNYVDRYSSNNANAELYDFGQGGYGGNKGWGGLFKSVTKTAATLGKKGLKAAQAGLAQLESAIENLDRPAGSSTSGRPYSNSGNGGPAAPSELDYDLPAERVLSIAIHISELPSSKQEEALARLPRPVRQKVMALLREQAVIEGEEQLQQQGTAAAAVDVAVIQTREFNINEETAAAAAAAAARVAAPVAHAQPKRQPPAPADAAAVRVQPAGTTIPKVVIKPIPAAAAAKVEEEDLLGMSAAAAHKSSHTAANVASVADMDDFFSGGTTPPAAGGTAKRATTSSPAAAAAAAMPRPRSAGPAGSSSSSSSMTRVLSNSEGHLADLLGGGGAGGGSAKSSSMINLGGLETLDVDVGAHGELYEAGDADGDEPELRRQLRAARLAEKHAKMKAALAEKQAKEAAEEQRRRQQQEHKQAHKERIEAWKNKNKGNVRGLLGSLQTVLWEDSGWKPIGMADLLEPTQVRKAWMKANLLVHPDKVRQRSGSDEQVAIADMIFDALKEAWGQFRA